MSEFGSESPRPWNIHTSSESQAQGKNLGSSANAISFGFVATAILISMFLIMALFEHLFKPTSSPDQDSVENSLESGPLQKLASSQRVSTTSYASDYTVLMPGQQYPTFIAQPAPLPCPREAVYWPSHEHSFAFP
uniref:Multidrug resistance protein n=1 Tax=Nicotiana tabacum TaxID=4097 RepID=A0A1S4AJ32_TOBAC|nr:PREDICTED: uncharacterized protein LOC107798200 [Nicotiana tabacum]